MSDKLLYKYYLRLRTEGFLKALLWGVAIGFGALAIFGMTHWMLGWKIAWLGWVIWTVVSAVSTFAFYKWKFRPTTKYIARRIDDLGLHERILTMTELEGDDSYIARKQREDALKALSSIRSELLTIGVSKPSLITAGVSLVLGVFGFLFSIGVFKDFREVNTIIPNTYVITYGVKEGEGSIQGKTEQSVAEGEMTEMVVAVPADGWRFLKWEDDTSVPYRSDEVDGKKTIVDIKSTANIGPAQRKLYEAGQNLYRKALEPFAPVEQLLILQLKKDGSYKLHELPLDYTLAEACLSLHKALKKKPRKRKETT